MATSWVCKLSASPPLPAQRHHHYRCFRRSLPYLFSSSKQQQQHLSTTTFPPPIFSTTSSQHSNFPTTADAENLIVQTLSSRQKEQISLYVQSLLQWNQRMNLTAVKEEGEVMTRHVQDSLAILPPLCRSYLTLCGASSLENLSLIDVGTGAGLPGLIFAVACPGWKITLLESMQKRCVFLEHAVDAMGLSNVHVLCDRAESVGQKPKYREAFDVAVARAVAEMRILAEYCLPFVRVGGLFVAAKGHDPQEEVRSAENAVRLMGASIIESCTVESHSPYGQRTAIICLKDQVTPRRYPRQPGIPSKTPL